MLHFKILTTYFLTLAYCLLTIADSRASDAKLTKMRFVQSGTTSSSWPLYVAEQKKIFEKNGLEMEVIVIRGSTNLVRAVISEQRSDGPDQS